MALAQTVTSNEFDTKMNLFAVGLLIIGILLCVVLCYGLHHKCKNQTRNWIRKQAASAGLTAVKVQPAAPQPQVSTIY